MSYYNQKHTPTTITSYLQELVYDTTTVLIDKQALDHNIQSYKNILNPASCAAVIKSNAYGHGIEEVATLCEENSNIDILCVAHTTEALLLRSRGIKKPILVLSIASGNLEKIILNDIDIVIFNLERARELNRLGQLLNKKAHIHIKVDTGLSRLGLYRSDAIELIEHIHELPFVSVRGIFSHFADSESSDQTFANHQIHEFNMLLDDLDTRRITIPLRHIACSAAATANHNSHHNLARIGIGLYGLWPSPENKTITHQLHPHFSLRPVLEWKTKIIQIKEIAAGNYVGYDRTYRTKKNSRIATLPIGYWDGYDRKLSNKGTVIINNQQAPIVGKVAMNLCMVDVTGLQASVGDDVILLGNYPGATADDIARSCDTINYEIVTRINPLIPRVIV